MRGGINYRLESDTSWTQHGGDQLNLNMYHLIISDEVAENPESRMLFSEKFIAGIKNYWYLSSDSSYSYHIGDLIADSERQMLDLNRVDICPVKDEESFMEALKYKKSRFSATIKHIQAKKIDYRRFINHGEVNVEKLLVERPHLFVYEDKNLPFAPDRDPPMPNEVFRNLSFYLNIQDIHITDNAYVEYRERAVQETTTGYINFTKGDIRITNLTNDPVLNTLDHPCHINFTAYFMDTGKVHIEMELPLLTEKTKV